MAMADRTIDPKILDAAKEEFLSKGYQDASLREICRNAGVTTGALYKRYPGKERLFEAVLEPTLQAVRELISDLEQYRQGCLARNKISFIWDLSEESLKGIMEYLYEWQDGFKLLLCHSEGTAYSGFLNDFVEENTKLTMKLMGEAAKRGPAARTLEAEEVHLLLTAYWSALFEPMIHDLSKEQAQRQCSRIVKFFNWQAVFKSFVTL